MLRSNITRIIVFLLLSIVFSGNLYAQESTETMRIGLTEISKPVFVPEIDQEAVFSGEIFYITNLGTFEMPEVNAQISDLDVDLPVSLTTLSMDKLPAEYKELARLWGFTVKWNGLDRQGFPAEQGRYTVIISAKILKKIVVIEKDAKGNDVEVIKEIESNASKSVPITVKGTK